MSNEVRISGNAYGPIAAGEKAHATQRNVTIGVSSGGGDLRAALDELRQALDEHEKEIPEVARVRRDVDALEREAADPDPDPDNVRDTLRRIAGRVGMVGAVLTAANTVRDAVEAILH